MTGSRGRTRTCNQVSQVQLLGRLHGTAARDTAGLVIGHAINVPSCTEVEWIGIEIKPRMFELFPHQYSARCNHYQQIPDYPDYNDEGL